MRQIEIIPEVKRLCIVGEYDSAMKLCDEIKIHEIAVKARLLCIEHEKSTSS